MSELTRRRDTSRNEETWLIFLEDVHIGNIGRRAGVANILGIHVSGLLAWWLWRTIYLMKLPRFEKKLRVALGWTLDLFFPKDLAQHLTLREIERVERRLENARQHPLISTVHQGKTFTTEQHFAAVEN